MSSRIVLCGLCVVFCCVAGGADKPTDSKKKLMKKKLTHTSGLLAAIARNKVAEMKKHGAALSAISHSKEWQKFNSPSRRLYSSEFARITGLIETSAKKNNTDEVTLHYLALTMTCVNCHKHLREGIKN